ncbi:hypothetical protein ACFL3E_02160 [Patescibacteria group bacterium]
MARKRILIFLAILFCTLISCSAKKQNNSPPRYLKDPYRFNDNWLGNKRASFQGLDYCWSFKRPFDLITDVRCTPDNRVPISSGKFDRVFYNFHKDSEKNGDHRLMSVQWLMEHSQNIPLLGAVTSVYGEGKKFKNCDSAYWWVVDNVIVFYLKINDRNILVSLCDANLTQEHIKEKVKGGINSGLMKNYIFSVCTGSMPIIKTTYR